MAETRDIADILRGRDAIKYSAIIERAENDGYHDYQFDMIPGHPEYADCNCPKIQLVEDLLPFPELQDIVEDTHHDRDINAAKSIKKYCLTHSPDVIRGVPVEMSDFNDESMKQEVVNYL